MAAIVGNNKHRLLDHSLLTAVMKRSDSFSFIFKSLKGEHQKQSVERLVGKGGAAPWALAF